MRRTCNLLVDSLAYVSACADGLAGTRGPQSAPCFGYLSLNGTTRYWPHTCTHTVCAGILQDIVQKGFRNDNAARQIGRSQGRSVFHGKTAEPVRHARRRLRCLAERRRRNGSSCPTRAAVAFNRGPQG